MDLSMLRSGAALLQELVLPADCAGCGRAGPALCRTCRGRLRPETTMAEVGGLTIASGLVYDDVARSALLAFKNEGRTDLGGPLSAALREAVAALLDGTAPAAPAALVPAPGTARSRHERGYEPVRVLLRRAHLPATDGLVLVRRARDQTELGREERIANVAGGMRARRRLAGLPVVLIDDVVTTGATLLEAARAVTEAGGLVLGAATVAATPRRSMRAASASHRNLGRSRDSARATALGSGNGVDEDRPGPAKGPPSFPGDPDGFTDGWRAAA
jgi:predicted amidophosphoribosyltransferase